MSYNIFEFLAGILVEPSENLNKSSEVTLPMNAYFSLCDFTVTIIIKGNRRYRHLRGKLDEQWKILNDIVQQILEKYCQQYYFTIELHKCGEWIHAHGLINMTHRSKVDKMRKEIYFHIEQKALKKGLTYKYRINIEKVYNIANWDRYIHKDKTAFTMLQKEFKNLQYFKKLKSSA